jgi:hypothetical protein
LERCKGVKPRPPRRGAGWNLGSGPRPLPPGPTYHAPGTAGKVEVMAWRARCGYQLHHPGDAIVPGGLDLN